jgi:hypothetical protein
MNVFQWTVALDLQTLGQRKLHGLGQAVHAPHGDGAQIAQPDDDLLHQDVGRRSASRQAHTGASFKPLGLQFIRVVHHMAGRAQLERHFAQAVAVGAGRAADHDHDVHLRAQQLHGVLAVLGGVADVLLLGLAHLGKPRLHCRQDAGRVVHRQGGLGDHGQQSGLFRLHAGHVLDVLDQMDALAELAHGALHLGVPLVADHEELVAFLVQFGHLHVHLGHQGAGGVENAESASMRLILHGLAHAMGREHQRGTGRHVGEFLDEDRTLVLQVVDHIGVVHDLVAHIDGPPELGERALDDLDGTVYPGAKATRFGQDDFLGLGHINSSLRKTDKSIAWRVVRAVNQARQ